jgi:toxin CptA
MSLMPASVVFAIAAVCAGLMGFAIQRGATCTVAAMDEIVRKRSASRLASMVEASLWVLGGLLMAQALNVLGTMPAGFAVTATTVLGGALLGLGAFVNGACVFGAIARLGSGEWAYLATPLGFYVGCLCEGIFRLPAQHALPASAPVLQASAWLALVFAAAMVWRIGRAWIDARAGVRDAGVFAAARATFATQVWSPRGATIVIGITFVVLLVLTGAWAYTDVLAELSRGMAGNLSARVLLALALLMGAIAGGWTAGRFRGKSITAMQLAKCFAGGALMGLGSLLIPGGNDGLILVGMPLLWPYAWVAFAAMCLTIGGAQWAQQAFAPRALRSG